MISTCSNRGVIVLFKVNSYWISKQIVILIDFYLFAEEELREKKAREGQKDTAEIYERAIREIQQITGESSDEELEAVVNKFIENEDRNFALFEYINDQNNKIEAFRDQIDKVKQIWSLIRVIGYVILMKSPRTLGINRVPGINRNVCQNFMICAERVNYFKI